MHFKIFILFLFNIGFSAKGFNGKSFYKPYGQNASWRYKYFWELLEEQNDEENKMCSTITNEDSWKIAKISENDGCDKKFESGDEQQFVLLSGKSTDLLRKKNNYNQTGDVIICPNNKVFPIYNDTKREINFPNFFENVMDMLRFAEEDINGHYRVVVPNYLVKQFLYFFFYPLLGMKFTGWLPLAIMRYIRGILFNVYFNPHYTRK